MSSPPKNAALNSVVANWLTPPPMSVANSPSWMTPPSTKPFSTVRRPTVSLTENVRAGRDERAPEDVGDALDVRDPRLAALVVGRERADDLLHAQPGGPLAALGRGLDPGRELHRRLARQQRLATICSAPLGAAHLGVLAADGRGYPTREVEADAGGVGRCRAPRRRGSPRRGSALHGQAWGCRPSIARRERRAGRPRPSTSVEVPPAFSVIGAGGDLRWPGPTSAATGSSLTVGWVDGELARRWSIGSSMSPSVRGQRCHDVVARSAPGPVCRGPGVTASTVALQRRLDRLGAAVALELDQRGRELLGVDGQRDVRAALTEPRLQPPDRTHRQRVVRGRCPSRARRCARRRSPRPRSPAVVVRVKSPASISIGGRRQLGRRAPRRCRRAPRVSRCRRGCRRGSTLRATWSLVEPAVGRPRDRDHRNDQQRGRDEPEDDLAASGHVRTGSRTGGGRTWHPRADSQVRTEQLLSVERDGRRHRCRSIPTPSAALAQRCAARGRSKDSLLYAVGVGAGQEPTDPHELPFVTENSMNVTQRALPTMAVVLADVSGAFADIGIVQPRDARARRAAGRAAMRELPVAGRVSSRRSEITAIWDKGKGAVVEVTARAVSDGRPRTAVRPGDVGVHPRRGRLGR